mmetsp:Transcript_4265/g.6376  ORF Transcript_4265/g.6376 Transcript_4265/m.6376 type:complete len:250 (-) Transcript_4265:368-1117(-)|eukprot:CAMPEP_0113936290 /NCGR_PEP_ID=MMETSP1339-20121228/3230_1 /TAXON_ID=94617 /ORGANISM="Fibrocapsa japonica" /LENGTH=249 /DNA_ID=CAMNT_0000938705 /DNA_START=174 /DNA_END=923 /DNA_ORIENTATION=- /assembly_acc=CAM_ASM_000762
MESKDGNTETSLIEAAALGSASLVSKLLDEGKGGDINAPGRDGTTPLCAASLWGHDTVVRVLLEHGADVNGRNPGTEWTALHAAAFQEHGPVVMALLQGGADPMRRDYRGRTPTDFASISEPIWPLFQAKGVPRTHKEDLIRKRIVRKVEEDKPGGGGGGASSSTSTTTSTLHRNLVPEISRPGSSYVRAATNPLGLSRPGSRIGTGRKTAEFKEMFQSTTDPLQHVDAKSESKYAVVQHKSSFKDLEL